MQTKATIKKSLVLQFTLPGYSGGASSSINNIPNHYAYVPPKQLEHDHLAECWSIEVNLDNARDTLRALRELTAAIETEIGKL